MKIPHSKSQRGFTIIELLIATTILSVILVLVTSMMLGIGKLFSKGINESRIQDAVRGTTDDVSQQVELGGILPSYNTDSEFGATIEVYCLGTVRYSFLRNVQIGSKPGDAPHVLWRDVPKGNCDPTKAADLAAPDPNSSGDATQGSELLPANSWLTAFCIGTLKPDNTSCDTSNLVSPYRISIGMAFGDIDQLNFAGTQTTCIGQSGDQFCATASLTTFVASRLANGVL